MPNNKELNKFLERMDGQMTSASFCGFCNFIGQQDMFSKVSNQIDRMESMEFENVIFDRLSQIIDNANATSSELNIKILNEEQQKQRQEKIGVNGKDVFRFTPDILMLNGPIFINNHAINWIDMKNFFITRQDKILFKKVKSACCKYTKAFGSGAIVCRGFEKDLSIRSTVFLDAFCL